MTAHVERLEDTVSHLASLPARVGAVERELAEFRAEMRLEFAAVRGEMRAGDDGVRAEMRTGFETLRAEVREGDEETRRYMRVLYEDLVERIKTMGEGIDDLRERP